MEVQGGAALLKFGGDDQIPVESKEPVQYPFFSGAMWGSSPDSDSSVLVIVGEIVEQCRSEFLSSTLSLEMALSRLSPGPGSAQAHG